MIDREDERIRKTASVWRQLCFWPRQGRSLHSSVRSIARGSAQDFCAAATDSRPKIQHTSEDETLHGRARDKKVLDLNSTGDQLAST